jgi:hypothetical protein
VTISDCPDLSDSSKVSFDESSCGVDSVKYYGTSYSGTSVKTVSYLNYASGVEQFLGQKHWITNSSSGGTEVDYYKPFEVYIKNSSSSSVSWILAHKLGFYAPSSGHFSYSNISREFTFEICGLVGSSGNNKDFAPITFHFSGTETYVSAYQEKHSYYLKPSSSSIPLHLGQSITASIASLFSVYDDYSKSNNTLINGYKDGSSDFGGFAAAVSTKVFGVSQSMLASASKPDSGSYTFKFDISSLGVRLSSGPYSVTGLAEGTAKFINLIPDKNAYQTGETIDLDDIEHKVTAWTNSYLTYADKEKIALKDVELNGSIIAEFTTSGYESLRSLPILLGTTYPSLTIKITIPTVLFGTITYSYVCKVAQKLPSSFTISSQKTDFSEGESLEYGASAKAAFLDSSGNAFLDSSGKSLDGSVSSLIESGILSKDPNVGSAISSHGDASLSGKTGQGIVTTSLFETNSFKYLVFVSYCDSFSLSKSALSDVYVDSGGKADFSSLLSSLTASYVFHSHTSASSYTSTKSVAYSALSFSSTEIASVTQDMKNYEITVTYNPSENSNQTLTAKILVNVYVNKCVSLKAVGNSNADSTVYYEGRENKFQKPTNVTFSKVWNNPSKASEELTEEELSILEYRLGKETGATAMIAGTSLVPSSQTRIYASIKLNGSYLESASYALEYTPDAITSLSLETPFSMVLGNKLGKYRNSGNCVLKATYSSGYIDDAFNDFSFVSKNGSSYDDTDKVIMDSSEVSTVYAKASGLYFDIPTNSKITCTVPEIESVTISGARNSYVNESDLIDYTNVTASVVYGDTDESCNVSATFSSGNVATSTEFSVSCTTSDGAAISSFSGTVPFSIQSFGTEKQISQTITLKILNRFDTSKSKSTDTIVSVFSLPTVKRISIVAGTTKTTYKVGEKFLGDDDGTQVRLYYGDGSSDYLTVRLKDQISSIIVSPSIGTEFTKTNDNMTVTVRSSTDTTIYTTYTCSVVSADIAAISKTHNIVAVMSASSLGLEELEGHYYEDSDGKRTYGTYFLVDSAYTEVDSSTGERTMRSGYSVSSIKVYGYLEDIFNKTLSASVILFDDYMPVVQSEANAVVTFPCYVPGNDSQINKCRIAKLFGNSNAKNRVFVSGNPDAPNKDWHSGPVNEYVQQGETVDANGDFTYFSDRDYCYYGQTDNAIMGYDIVSTDKMMVIKSKSNIEPTNYFRSAGTTQAMDGGGNLLSDSSGNAIYMESFSLSSGNIGIGAMNIKSVCNLNGDTMFISADNTICGLDISGQVGDSQRIANSRSKRIDPELKSMDLSDAMIWTDNKYVLVCASERTYVTNYETISSDDYQYEWWRIDVAGITAIAEIDGKIFFGNSYGSLYYFKEGCFFDCDKIFIGAGGTFMASLNDDYGDNEIVYSEELNSKISDDSSQKYTFNLSPSIDSDDKFLFIEVGTIRNEAKPNTDLIIDYTDGTINLVAIGKDGETDYGRLQELEEELADDCWYYLSHCDEDGLSIAANGPLSEYYRKYKLRSVDKLSSGYSASYVIVDADGNDVPLSVVSSDGSGNETSSPRLLRAKLCKKMEGEYDVVSLNKEECSFKLSKNGKEVNVIKYEPSQDVTQSFRSELHSHTSVKSYFICGAAKLGSLGYRKTIWSWTLTASYDNDLEVCEATNEANLESMRSISAPNRNASGMALGKIEFYSFDMSKSIVPRKYTYVRPISVPFISFGFRSNESRNSVLNDVSIVYSIPIHGFGRN